MSWSVLAVDQSATSTGWAQMKHGQRVPTWGRFTLPPWKDHEGERLWMWFSWLGQKITECQCSHVVLEDTFIPQHHEELSQRIAQYGQIGMADAACFLLRGKGLNVEFSVVKPGVWRAEFLGSAAAPKGLVKHQRRAWLKDRAVSECHKRGWLVDSNDVADALGILDYSCAAIDPAYASTRGALFRRAEAYCEDEQRSLK